MADILSQNEIDALLSALSSGAVTAETIKDEQEQKQVRLYDFKRQNKFSKEHLRTISMIHENFARIFSTALSAQLRVVVLIEVASVEQLTYDEYMRSVPSPSLINLFSLSPLPGTSIMEMNMDLGSAVVDRMLGGPGKVSRLRRDLTEIERALISNVSARGLDCMREAWADVVKFAPKHEGIEMNPRFIQIVPPTDVVVLITFEARFGEASGPLSICIPYVVLESVINQISSQMMFSIARQENTPEMTHDLRKRVEQTMVPMQVLLGATNVSVGDILRLAPGDVVPLGGSADQDLQVLVGEKLKYLGRPGVLRNKMAVQITETVTERELEDE